MFVPPRTTPARRLPSVARAVATGLLAGVLTTACTEPAAGPVERVAQPTTTPLSAYGADGPVLTVADPCAEVPGAVLADVLGSEATTSLAWAPGQRLPGTPELGDEHGCRHAAGDVTASAWVFAAPTTPAQARRLAKEATGRECRRRRDVATFGDPGVAFSCDSGTVPLAGMRGLVGSSWVACEVSGTDDTDRLERWCAAVLESLSAG